VNAPRLKHNNRKNTFKELLFMDENSSLGSTLSRKSFLKLAVASLVGVSSLLIGVPLIGMLIGSSYQSKKLHFSKLANIDSLSQGQPENINFADMTEDAYIHTAELHNVWVVKNSQSDISVYSPICPHLGCRYDWDSGNDQFVCPCHGSVFSLDGKVLAGPSPRPLDTLPTQIENGELYVEWEHFKIGIPTKEAA
jgi:menaquinol-cytochrome c reductase iron-sulfur subunit